jgi:acetyltransferase-like isoleucine patch superfamily enzyme
VYGRPYVHNEGTLIVGQRVLIWSTIVRSEFVVFPGGRLEIGDRTSIHYGASIAATGLVRLGPRCRLGTHVMILDNDFHEIENRDVRPEPRPVILEENVWLANRVLVLPGVTIGHDSVVGAGSVVMTSIPPRSIALGNPARVVRTF